MNYFNLPTRKNQVRILSLSILGYGILLLMGDFLLPELDEFTKKRLTQAGILALYLATLNAGLGFVWTSKGRQNERIAQSVEHENEERIKLLSDQAMLLGISYHTEIQKAQEAIAEAQRQIQAVKELPSVYEWCGAASLLLVAAGTLLCFIGAG
jgi:hypothetical protein